MHVLAPVGVPSRSASKLGADIFCGVAQTNAGDTRLDQPS